MTTFQNGQKVRVTEELLKAYEGESDGTLETLVGKEGRVVFTVGAPEMLVCVKWDHVDTEDFLWFRELEAV
jgi:hypothetical protein